MKEDNLGLEKEFNKYARFHKFSVIYSALSVFEDDIYDTRFLKEYKNVKGQYDDKSKNVISAIVDKGDEELDRIYEFCWDRISSLIPDNKVYEKKV